MLFSCISINSPYRLRNYLKEMFPSQGCGCKTFWKGGVAAWKGEIPCFAENLSYILGPEGR